MLVMHGQRFGRFPLETRRAVAQIEQTLPDIRGRRVVAAPPQQHGVRIQCLGAEPRPHLRGSRITGQGVRCHPGPLVQPPDAERFACGLRPRHSFVEQLRRPRGQQRQRQQVATVVLEHRVERPRIAGAHVVEIARGDLESLAHRLRARDQAATIRGC